MKTHLKMTSALIGAIRADLERPHPFAHERVGFILAGLAKVGADLAILAHTYQPIADEDYLDDPTVGAMMGPAAIRKALQQALQTRSAALHVHMHDHRGQPGFSAVDLRENAKFVPNFFNVGPQRAHGAIVLSRDGVAGQIWTDRLGDAVAIDRFTAVGPKLGLLGAFQ